MITLFHPSMQVDTAFGDMDLFSTIYRYRTGSKYVELNAVPGFGWNQVRGGGRFSFGVQLQFC